MAMRLNEHGGQDRGAITKDDIAELKAFFQPVVDLAKILMEDYEDRRPPLAVRSGDETIVDVGQGSGASYSTEAGESGEKVDENVDKSHDADSKVGGAED